MLPVILTAFANQEDEYLASLIREQRGIQAALADLDKKGVINHVVSHETNIEHLFALIQSYQGNIRVFHYAGHANGTELALQGRAARFRDLAKELVLRNPDLDLVFLNGCATLPHVKTLLEVGVKAVIATATKIKDQQATDFAIKFYENLAAGDSLQIAYESASNFVKIGSNDEQFRFLGAIQSEIAEVAEFPWGLYGQALGEGGIHPTLVDAYNEWLVRHAIEAISPHAPDAARVWQYVQDNKIQNWEKQAKYAKKAKEVLAYSFVGIVGIQLGRLMAIGNAPPTEAKPTQFIEKCLYIAQRTLDLVSFAFVSRLWDSTDTKSITWKSEQQKVLKTFFERDFEPDFLQQYELLATLWAIFTEHQLAMPFADMEAKPEIFAEHSLLRKACGALLELSEILDQQKEQARDCIVAERQLTIILKQFAFLAAYKMASIKQVSYQHVRQAAPQYLHRYNALGIDNKATQDAEKLDFIDPPVNSEAVLLYRDNKYHEGINLFPFVIDYNALSQESGAKICFFTNCDIAEPNSLDYVFVEDASTQHIQLKDIAQKHENLTEIFTDKEQMKQLRLDNVVLLFAEAKRDILPSKEASGGGAAGEGATDDFDALFN